jgi:hypothetical protein
MCLEYAKSKMEVVEKELEELKKLEEPIIEEGKQPN